MRKRKEPEAETGKHCSSPYPCPFLDHCQRDMIVSKYSVACLTGTNTKRLRELIEVEGVDDLRKVPDDLLSPKLLRVKKHTLAGTTYFNAEGAASALARHKLPALFLDFETISMPIPIWKGTKPFQKIPFQFSLHRLSRTGALSHQEFLDLTGKDPSRRFAAALIAACAGRSPIFVYSSFENTVIRDLAKRFVKLSQPLLAIAERLVDLLPIVTEHYYHPDQQGRWGIKSVLPTLAPDLSYDSLEGVQNGGMAMLVYQEAIAAKTTDFRRNEIRDQLLKYCHLDTMAMVRVWRYFASQY